MSLVAKKTVVDCLVIAAFSAAFHTATIDWHGLGYDEAEAAAIASLPDFSEMFTTIVHDGNPPLYYFILRGWASLVGQTDVVLKILPLLIAVALPTVVFFIVNKRLGRAIAYQAAILITLCPPLVSTSDMLRPYGLLAILALLSFDQLYNLLQKPTSWGERLKYALLLAGLMYTHIFAAAVPLGHVFLILAGSMKRWWQRNQLIGWTIASSISFLLFAPWLPVIPEIFDQSTRLWRAAVNPMQVCTTVTYMLFNITTMTWPVQPYITWMRIASAVLLVFCVFGRPKPEQMPASADYSWLAYCQITAIGTVVAYFIIFTVMPRLFFGYHYVTSAIVLILITFVGCTYGMTSRFGRLVSLAAPIIVMLPMWAPQIAICRDTPLSPEHDSIQVVNSELDKDRDLIVCMCTSFATQFDRELPQNVRLLAFPELERIHFVRWTDLDKRMRDENNCIRLEETINKTLANGGRIWLATNLPNRNLPPDNKFKPEYDQKMTEDIVSRRIFNWLRAHASPVSEPVFVCAREGVIVLSHFRARTMTAPLAAPSAK